MILGTAMPCIDFAFFTSLFMELDGLLDLLDIISKKQDSKIADYPGLSLINDVPFL